MANERLYCLCQLLGWSSFAMLGVVVLQSLGAATHENYFTILFETSCGLLGSHVLRMYLKPLHQRELRMGMLTLRSTFGIVAIGAVLGILTYGQSKISPQSDPFNIEATYLLIWVNWTFILAAWSSVYLGVHYFWRLQGVVVEKWKLQAALHRAQLNTLRAQLNPHFMFNMLNSLRALIDEDPNKAREVVTRLSRLLRNSLKEEGTTIDLAEELEGVRDYLSLEQVRLEERLFWQVEAHPETLSLQVPRMLILNLVENAIKHGISKKPLGGKVLVSTFKSHSSWKILVSNTGSLGEGPDEDGGLGLRNTRERLLLYYGPEARLCLANEGSDEVRADVFLPLETRAITREPMPN